MIQDNEWQVIAGKAFPKKTAKAPLFLWTRILARIEAVEVRAASKWWMQWRWMSRVTATVGLIVSLGVIYLLRQDMGSLDAALEGRSSQEQALQLVSSGHLTLDDSASLVMELDS